MYPTLKPQHPTAVFQLYFNVFYSTAVVSLLVQKNQAPKKTGYVGWRVGMSILYNKLLRVWDEEE